MEYRFFKVLLVSYTFGIAPILLRTSFGQELVLTSYHLIGIFIVSLIISLISLFIKIGANYVLTGASVGSLMGFGMYPTFLHISAVDMDHPLDVMTLPLFVTSYLFIIMSVCLATATNRLYFSIVFLSLHLTTLVVSLFMPIDLNFATLVIGGLLLAILSLWVGYKLRVSYTNTNAESPIGSQFVKLWVIYATALITYSQIPISHIYKLPTLLAIITLMDVYKASLIKTVNPHNR